MALQTTTSGVSAQALMPPALRLSVQQRQAGRCVSLTPGVAVQVCCGTSAASQGNSAHRRILDAGCGSAGLLWHLCGIAGELGASAYLRGVTAGKEVHPSLEGVTCPLKDQSAESTATSKKNDGPCASVDVRVYHRFPLERCLTA